MSASSATATSPLSSFIELGEVLLSPDNHVFDRGYASKEWLGLLLSGRDHFLMHSPSAYKLANVLGRKERPPLFCGRKGCLLSTSLEYEQKMPVQAQFAAEDPCGRVSIEQESGV